MQYYLKEILSKSNGWLSSRTLIYRKEERTNTHYLIYCELQLHMEDIFICNNIFFDFVQGSVGKNIKEAFSDWITPQKTTDDLLVINKSLKPSNKSKEVYIENISQKGKLLKSFIQVQIRKSTSHLLKRIQNLQNLIAQMSQGNREQNKVFVNSRNTTDADFYDKDQLSQMGIKDFKQNHIDTLERDSSSFTSSTKNIIEINVDSEKNEQFLINPNNQRQWSKHYKQIQKIIEARKNGIIAWSQQQKRAVISFVNFGIKIGLRKKKLIQIANVSQSSLKRWRKMYSN